ncbi:DUF4435 domain-containing protein, partial [Halorubrum sp. GN11_10-6_MGM]
VISATGAFEDLRGLHDLDCYGLIDRDYRTDEEIKSLEAKSVHVTQVSEIENLLITEEVLRVFAEEKHFDEAEDTSVNVLVGKAKEAVFDRLEEEKERLAASIAAYRIRRVLERFGPDQDDREALKDSFEEVTTVDTDVIYQDAEDEISAVLRDRD